MSNAVIFSGGVNVRTVWQVWESCAVHTSRDGYTLCLGCGWPHKLASQECGLRDCEPDGEKTMQYCDSATLRYCHEALHDNSEEAHECST